MTREEFYKLTDILNSEVLGNFMHGGEADELIAMFEEAIEHSNILKQEELVSKDYRERYKRIAQSEAFKRTHEGRSVGEIMHVEGEECISEIDFGQELYKAFGQVKDFTLGLQIAKRFYDMGKNHQEPVSEQNLSNVERIGKDWKEEPVSEDLKEIAWNHADKKCHLDIAVFTSDEVKKEREKMQFTWQDLYDAVMFGAQWQKKQMMKDAIERVVKVDAGGYPYIDGTIELYDYSEDKPLAKAGDKVRNIVVKED